MGFVFISYAREDAAAAFRLSEALKEAGIETWFDQERMVAGQNWPMETRRAIRQCDFFVALLSSRSLSKRGFVQREIKEALDVVRELPDHQTFVIPVRLDDCEVDNDVLRNIQRVDLFPSWELGITRIISALRGLTQPAPAVPAPASGAARRDEGADLLRDALALNVLPRRNYVPRLLAGACLLGVVITVSTFLVGMFQIDTRKYSWKGPAEGAIALATTLAFVLLASGVVRWRVAARVRRQIVASNELVRGLFADRHPFVYRLLLGNWAWRALWVVLCFVLLATAAGILLLLVIAFAMGRNGEWGGVLFFFLLTVAPGILIVVTFSHIHRVWRSYQEKAGVPGPHPGSGRKPFAS